MPHFQVSNFTILCTVGFVVVSYLVFPSWKMLGISFPAGVFLSISYLTVLKILLCAFQANEQKKINDKHLAALAYASSEVMYLIYPMNNLSIPDDIEEDLEMGEYTDIIS